ncbi:MAG TPA: M28 family peptidase [Saprospiraceae bacterium]|nr:M28 family peptidase [Saprospiraceae bacterium]
MRIVFFVLCLLCSFNTRAQSTPPTVINNEGISRVFAETIIPERLRRHLMILAGDGMEGRETGTAGLKKAAEYIKGRLENYHIAPFGKKDSLGIPSYFQPFVFHKEAWGKRSIHINNTSLTTADYAADLATNAHLPSLNVDEVLFLGYGIDDASYSDYAGVETKGKVIVILEGEPRKNGEFFISPTKAASDWSHNDLRKYDTALKHGVKLVLVIKDTLSLFPVPGSGWKLGEGVHPEGKMANNFQITHQTAQLLLGKKYKKLQRYQRKIAKKGKPKHFSVPVAMKVVMPVKRKILKGANLLAIVEGSDPKLKNEYIFISAHYDHLGKRGTDVYNGADDNGSGSSALIEIAHAFAQAKESGNGPKRSLVFMWMAGEEKGLLGSRYYVHAPLVPLKNTVADINIDMIGRVDETHAGNPNYIYVIGADRLSTDLDKIVKSANSHTKLLLDYKYNAADDPNRFYYRSDHYNFAKNNIPSVFFFNGTHEDYHRPTDTVDKINFDKMAKIGKLTFYTAWEIANRPDRLKVDVLGRN